MFKVGEPRNNNNMSFNSWMNKVSRKDMKDDYIPETEGPGFRFGEGISLLHEYLRRCITWRDYVSRLKRLTIEERQAAYEERLRLGVSYLFFDTMGLYNGNGGTYEQSVEYLTRNQASEQQGTVQTDPSTRGRRTSAVHYTTPAAGVADW